MSETNVQTTRRGASSVPGPPPAAACCRSSAAPFESSLCPHTAHVSENVHPFKRDQWPGVAATARHDDTPITAKQVRFTRFSRRVGECRD
eukprot:3887400-Prymnesium_polylepis.2